MEQGILRGTVARVCTRALVASLLVCFPGPRAWAQAGDGSAAGPVLVPGARVRVVVREPGLLPTDAVDRTRPAEAEGRYVALDSATLTLQLRGWRGFALPRGMVRGLEVRDGPGFCAANLGGRLVCLGLGLAGGWAIAQLLRNDGFTNGREAGPQEDPEAVARADERRWRRQNLSVALSVGALASFGFGRSRWVPVRGWPIAPAPSPGG